MAAEEEKDLPQKWMYDNVVIFVMRDDEFCKETVNFVNKELRKRAFGNCKVVDVLDRSLPGDVREAYLGITEVPAMLVAPAILSKYDEIEMCGSITPGSGMHDCPFSGWLCIVGQRDIMNAVPIMNAAAKETTRIHGIMCSGLSGGKLLVTSRPRASVPVVDDKGNVTSATMEVTPCAQTTGSSNVFDHIMDSLDRTSGDKLTEKALARKVHESQAQMQAIESALQDNARLKAWAGTAPVVYRPTKK